MDNLKDLTESDIKIMSNSFDPINNIGLSKAKAITIEEVYEKTKDKLGLSESKVRYTLNMLVKYGYMDFGIKKGKKKTYYITPEGCEFIKEIKNMTEI